MCLSCEIPWKAVVRFEDVPANPTPHQMATMEEQLRHAYTITEVINGVAFGTHGAEVCATLAKQSVHLTQPDLVLLNRAGRALFDPNYASAVP